MQLDFTKADSLIENIIKKEHFAGVSICVKGPDGIAFEKGYGWRDAAHEIAPDPDTMFGIASMSKSITALALAILESEGKVSYDDPVAKFFPGFSVPGAAKDMVTLRMLAMHTAGIPPMEPLEWSIAMNSERRDSQWLRNMRATSPNKMETIEQVIDYIASCPYPTVGAPGENMSYSNEGYAILSYVVDQVAGIPLEKFCEERIFRPLGMTRTVMDDDCVSARAMSGGNITSLFELDEDGETLLCDDFWSILPPFRGCAMVKSTARDMAAYYRALSNMGMHEGKQVLPRAAVERMIGAEIPAKQVAEYGLGLYKRVKEGHVICEHAGGLHGVSTKGGLIKDEGWGFAVLCNTGDTDMDDIMWILYNVVLGLPEETSHRWFIPAGRAFSEPELLTGAFIGHEGDPVVWKVYMQDGQLFAETSGRVSKLIWCGAGRFLAVKPEDESKLDARVEFFVREGHAWGLRVGSRIFGREESK